MINMFDGLRYRRPGLTSWLAGRALRVLLGMTFIYVGVNLAGDLVRSKAGSNQLLKDLVQRYDAVSIVESVVADVGNAIADSVDQNGAPTSAASVNNQAKTVSVSLENHFRSQLPAVNKAFEEVVKAVITPFQEAIHQGELKR